MFSRSKKWNIKPSKDKKKFQIPKRVWVYLFLILLCVVGVIYVLRLPEYQVRGVEVKNSVFIKESDIKSIAEEYLSYTYFYFIPQSNIWLYPKQKILKKIMAIPSIDGAKISLVQNRILSISVEEKDNKFIFCNQEGACFYMNERGYVFAPAPIIKGNAFLTFRGLMEGELVGKYFLTEAKISSILDFVSKLKEKGLDTTLVEIKTEREVTLTLRTGTKLIISIEKDLDDTYRNIKTILESRDFVEKSGGIEKVDYIDLRYGKKAFWKGRATL